MRLLLSALMLVSCSTRKLPLGGACESTSQCAVGLVCAQNTCQTPSLAGACAGAPCDSSFTITATDVSLADSGSATTTVTVTRGNAQSGAITVTLGTAEGFTAQPLTIAAGAASGTLTINSSSAACGPAALTLSATDGTSTAAAQLTATVNQPANVTLALAPTGVTVLKGGSTTVDVTVTRAKCSPSTVSVMAAALPPGITAVAATGATGHVALTISANLSAALGSTMASVTGAGASTPLQVTVSGTMQARVIDGYGRPVGAGDVFFKAPLPGAATDASGNIALSTTAPFDLAFGVTGLADYEVKYLGVTDAQPTIQIPIAITAFKSVPVQSRYGASPGTSVELTGGIGAPVASGATVTHITERTVSGNAADGVWWSASWREGATPGAQPVWCASSVPLSCNNVGKVNSYFYPEASDSANVVLHALQFAATAPDIFTLSATEYSGYAAQATTAVVSIDNTTPMAMAPVATAGDLQEDLTLPSGYTAALLDLYVQVGVHGRMRIGTALASSMTRKTPAIAGAKTNVLGSIFLANGTLLPVTVQYKADQPLTGTVALAPAPAARQTSPDDGATLIDATTNFTWSDFPEGAYVVAISQGLSLKCQIITTQRPIHIEVGTGTAAGCKLKPGNTYAWQISAIGGHATMAAVTQDAFGFLTDANQITFRNAATERSGSHSLSELRFFTVATP